MRENSFLIVRLCFPQTHRICVVGMVGVPEQRQLRWGVRTCHTCLHLSSYRVMKLRPSGRKNRPGSPGRPLCQLTCLHFLQPLRLINPGILLEIYEFFAATSMCPRKRTGASQWLCVALQESSCLLYREDTLETFY